jgi:hypothetical protein
MTSRSVSLAERAEGNSMGLTLWFGVEFHSFFFSFSFFLLLLLMNSPLPPGPRSCDLATVAISNGE